MKFTTNTRNSQQTKYRYVKSCAVQTFSNLAQDSVQQHCRLRDTMNNMLVRDETRTFQDADVKGHARFWLEHGTPLKSTEIAIRTIVRGASSAEKELVMDVSDSLLKLREATCKIHNLDRMKSWRLRKTNIMGDAARVFQDETGTTCGSQLEHGSMVMIEEGEPPRVGMLRLRLIVWMPTLSTYKKEDDDDEASLASRIRSQSLVEIKKQFEIHNSTTVKDLKSKIMTMSEFSKWKDINPKRVRLRFMGLSNYPGLILKDEDAELVSFRTFKRSKSTYSFFCLFVREISMLFFRYGITDKFANRNHR